MAPKSKHVELGVRAPYLEADDALSTAPPVSLAGWDGRPAIHDTTVRLGHRDGRLHVLFSCAFDCLNVDRESPLDRPVPGLWRRDVVEVFLSDGDAGVPYREVEASPLGQWLALSFVDRRRPDPRPWPVRPGVTARLAGEHRFEVVVVLSLAEAHTNAAAAGAWRIGLFRIHGDEPAREHLALVPTGTGRPDFHRPERWVPLALASPTPPAASTC